MKTLKLNLLLAFFGLALFTSCGGAETEQKATEETAPATEQVAGAVYTCPMHPEVVSDEPGKCPKCGMFLEKVTPGQEPDSAAAAQSHEGDHQH